MHASRSRSAHRLLAWLLLLPFFFRKVHAFTQSALLQKLSTSRSSHQNSRGTLHTLYLAGVPIIEDWKVLKNGRVVGIIKNHPSIPQGDTITTSPIDRPESAAPRKTITTVSGSKYQLGKAAKMGAVANSFVTAADLQRRARVAFDLSGEKVGDETRQYLLAGKPDKSTSGKSKIYKAYRGDVDGLPTGPALTVKMSTNWEAIEREADNYSKITKAGFLRGQFIEMLDFLPEASEISNKFRGMSALVLERGAIDVKKYLAINGGMEGKQLRDAAAAAALCIQAIHGSGLVWTDMKTENFVLDPDGVIKGIDLESCMPIRGNPVDYSPEGTPPEFARAFLAGDGPYFVLATSYDIWSLGMLYYELATGKGYFDNRSPVQITKLLRDTDSLKIDLTNVEDRRFRNLIAKCLQVDPRKRPSILEVLLHPYFLSSGLGPFSF